MVFFIVAIFSLGTMVQNWSCLGVPLNFDNSPFQLGGFLVGMVGIIFCLGGEKKCQKEK